MAPRGIAPMTFALLLLYIIICILRSESDAFIHTSQFSGVPLAQRIARWTSNPKVLGSIPRWDGKYFWFAITLYPMPSTSYNFPPEVCVFP